MNFKDIMLSKRSQVQKGRYCMIHSIHVKYLRWSKVTESRKVAGGREEVNPCLVGIEFKCCLMKKA